MKRVMGMRYGAAYMVKVATDSLLLSFILTRYVVLLLFIVQEASRGAVMGSSAGRVAVMTIVIMLFVFLLCQYAMRVKPELVSGIPPLACSEKYGALYRPALLGYCGVTLGLAYVICVLLSTLLVWLPSTIYSLNSFIALMTMFVVLIFGTMYFYYVPIYSVNRVVKQAIQEERHEELLAEERPRLQAARASISCWRLGWTAWVVEVLIYAGLSWALWRALADGGVAWGQWRLATYAALGVAALRLFERLSPRWAPKGRAEAWAWRVRVLRLGIALAACAA